MREVRFLVLILIVLHLTAPARAGAGRPRRGARRKVQAMRPTRSVAYKTVKGAKLTMHIFEPEGHKPSERRPAIVFFFGGGWVGGTPQQFYPQCKYLASRGMVAISAEYRVRNRHGATPYECVTDGKSAIRWARASAAKLGMDPNRLAAGGGSAGAHVAACTGVVDGLEEAGEDASVSSKPNALVLFNPPLLLDWEEWKKRGIPEERLDDIRQRFKGQDPRRVSPCHHVGAGAPPTLILHGEADTTIPIQTARAYVEAAKRAGSRCELAAYEGQGHGFFNFGRGEAFYQTMREVDRFLVSLGYLEGPATLERFRESLEE